MIIKGSLWRCVLSLLHTPIMSVSVSVVFVSVILPSLITAKESLLIQSGCFAAILCIVWMINSLFKEHTVRAHLVSAIACVLALIAMTVGVFFSVI